MTSYVAIHVSYDLKSILDPFSVSTPMGDSIMAKKVYRGCVVSICSRETLVDLIELDMLDFDIILGMG